jgi:hypothetical protein
MKADYIPADAYEPKENQMPKKPEVAHASKPSTRKPKTHNNIELVHSPIPPGQAAQQETDKMGTRSLARAALAITPAGTQQKGALGRARQSRRERPLITAEEYAHVQRDLKTIGLLSVLMITIIIVLSLLLN